jgi:hypothetical protein
MLSVFWRWLTALLVWLSADPSDVDAEAPRAAAACAAAYAAFARDEAPAPPQPPAPGKCCQDCAGTGTIRHGDGHATPCPCPPQCKCKAGKDCRRCVPAASPASEKPASL